MQIEENSAEELFNRLNELDESDIIEAKAFSTDSSKSILETVCSLSNEPGLGGGVILLGIAENKETSGERYYVEGVDNPDKAQLDFATQCKSVFNIAVYPVVKVEKVLDKTVLKIVVDELPPSRKPLYFKNDGLPKGAYRRIGSADLVATDDDLWCFYEDPENKYDETPVRYSSISDVDERAVQRYREMRKKVDPDAVELEYETQELLTALGCTCKDNPNELNMAGILLFGKELAIKRACTLARVDYIRILSNDWAAVADGFDGIDTYAPIFLMVDRLLSIIYGELTTRHRFHRDSIQPEIETFPVEVMREALVNMLMHRDYRHGQLTQIIRYNNRIEICNSGCSLKPDDMLGIKGSVLRNSTIARVCHDTKLAETKGSGIDRMWRKMTAAGLSRPTMESDRHAATFTIRLLLCHFFDEETIEWLKQFAEYDFNDNQRTALVFLREVGAIDAVAYRQLTGCAPKLVSKELAGLKDQGLTLQKGRARGTYYVPTDKLLNSEENAPVPRGIAPSPKDIAPVRSEIIQPQKAETIQPQDFISQPFPNVSPMGKPISTEYSIVSMENAEVRRENAEVRRENAEVRRENAEVRR
ncbi:MAG: putative DNA binding domain-containing protein, partial [Victivallales bacterium]|nr:putative DNA binding domain-containing protein [Victivallales bacterium]